MMEPVPMGVRYPDSRHNIEAVYDNPKRGWVITASVSIPNFRNTGDPKPILLPVRMFAKTEGKRDELVEIISSKFDRIKLAAEELEKAKRVVRDIEREIDDFALLVRVPMSISD